MLCLGVETSCDETGLALVRDGVLLHEALSSQVPLHRVFGGVVPEIASREHLRMLDALLHEVFRVAGADAGDIEGIAVARGPGLLGSLLVGLGFAKAFAAALEVPLIGVNHLHAHLLAAGLEGEISFPAIGLLVSGGHTQLYRVDSPFSFTLLGRTLDDAAGEAFDKTAKLLNLPYPGGAVIDRLSERGSADEALFPKPYVRNDNLDFSFSGLKTAVAEYVLRHPGLAFGRLRLDEESVLESAGKDLRDVCASLTRTVVETLRIKTERALDRHPDCSTLLLAGGVAANSLLRSVMGVMAKERGCTLIVPGRHLCTDNAAMIAYLGETLLRQGWRHDLHIDAVPRGRPMPEDAFQVCPVPRA